MTPLSKTVAIVGSHPATRDAAPWDDPHCEVWVFNEAANSSWCRRADVVFQLHAPVIYRSRYNRSDPGHWDWLQAADPKQLSVVMQACDPAVPASVRYPLDEVCAELLGEFRQSVDLARRRYFTSSIAYAIALAIFKNYRRIRIYGVEMASNTEYTYQREGVLFWLGVALGRGIRVEMHSGDGIFARPLYGYEGMIETQPDTFEQRASGLRIEQAAARRKLDNAAKSLQVSYNLPSLGDRIGDAADAAAALGEIEGRLGEAEKYIAKIRDMWQASGTAVIDRYEYEGAAGAASNALGERVATVHRTAGRLDIYLDLWTRTRRSEYRQAVVDLARAHIDAAHKEGILRGVVDENTRLARETDELLRSAGGAKALQAVVGGD